MAHVKGPSKRALGAVAAGLGDYLRRRQPKRRAGGAVFEIAESFPVWLLRPDATRYPDRRLRDNAVDVGRWHHQIRENGKPAHVAHSVRVPSDARGWKVLGVSGAHLARKVSRAVLWIDEHAAGD